MGRNWEEWKEVKPWSEYIIWKKILFPIKEGNGKKINKILKRILNTLGRRKFPEDFLVHLPNSTNCGRVEDSASEMGFLKLKTVASVN